MTVMLPNDFLGLANTTNSPSPVSSDSFPEHDSLLQDESNNEDSAQSKRKSRRPPSTAERRATHNAVERARRESLNGRFMELAGVLPNMANVKRPSKSVIVAKSLEFVQTTQNRERQLISQNDSLRQEINELRARLGMAPVTTPSPAIQPSSNRMRKASSVTSSVGTESPVISTPPSLGSFDNISPAAPSYAFNTAFTSSFAAPTSAPMHEHQSPAQPAIAKTCQPTKDDNSPPATTASYSRPAIQPDVNYIMAMSMQQQHHLMNMQNMASAPGFQHLAPWLMAHNQATPPTISAGGEGSWLSF